MYQEAIKNEVSSNAIYKAAISKRDIIVLGSGPAGYSAAIYAARANLKPLILTGKTPGGQLTITTDVENYPGHEAIMGPDLMEIMRNQAVRCGAEIIEEIAVKVDFSSCPFVIHLENGDTYYAKSVIISTGAEAKWLNLPTEQEFLGYGVSGCATCDGFFFKGKIVCVVGGGNTAVEEALYLTHHAQKVYLIHRRDSLRADKTLQKRLFENDKIEIIWNHEVKEVLGVIEPVKHVKGLRLSDTISGTEKNIELQGVFIAIGHKPNTSIFKDQLDLDEDNYIITTPGTCLTNIKGIFAAGDVQDKIYRQAITAAGSGCMAALDAERFLSGLEIKL